MYLSLKGGAPPPWELTRAQICERMGWTFADYDALDWADVLGLLQVWDGVGRSRK